MPAVVVGSGYGGAVSALRLGQAGVETLVLEMGRAWDKPGRDGRKFSSTLRPDGRSMWFRSSTRAPVELIGGIPIDQPIDRYAGVLDRMVFDEMSVFVGRGVGGGSLVNGGMAVTPRREDFERILPQVDAAEMYAKYFPRANAQLGSNEVPRDWFETTPVYQYARLGRAQAQRAGFKTAFVPSTYDYSYMVKEAAFQVPRSATGQEVIYGNNHGKRSVDLTYLPAALATGNVTISPLTQVTAIRREPDGTYVLSLRTMDERGRNVTTRELGCRHLFLNAGAMGTTELLLRARETGTLQDLSEEVGLGWGNNGNITAMRGNRMTAHTGNRQSTMPAMGIDCRDDPKTRMFIEITPLPTGFENLVTGYLAITANPERAALVYDAATDRAKLTWKRSQAAPSITAIRSVLDKINRVEGTTYRRDLYKGGRTFGDHYTWHPLGGCLLGKATDTYGRAKGYDGLYVNDSSLLPGFTSVNPFVTITALAERNVERVIAEDVLA
ncbi:MAG: GMC family oxidoreductase [Solirubrobacteraceae bacterium]|nr:GMC family oxidoreductase [Solirubrobacteraceae bacterium]